MLAHRHITLPRFKKHWLILRNTGLLSVANILDRLIAFAVVIAIGRELGLQEFGRYSLGVAIGAIVFQVSSLGLEVIVRRETARDSLLIGRYVGNAFPLEILTSLAGIGLTLILCLAAGYETSTAWIILAIAVVFAFEPLVQLLFAVFESQERMEYEAVVMAWRILLLVSLPIVLLMGWGLIGIIVVWGIVNVLRLGTALWLTRSRFAKITLQIDLRFWKHLLHETYPLAFALLFNAILYRIDAVMLSFYRPETEVGIYNAAYSFLNVLAVVSVAFLRSVFPSFARQASDPQRLSRTFYQALAIMAVVGLIIAVAISALADPIMTIVFTSKFASSADALIILAWAALFLFTSSVCSVMLNATGRQKSAMYVIVCMAIVNVALNLWLIPQFGYIGASYVTLVTYAFGLIVMLVIIVRDFRRPEYLIALNASSPSLP
jgi:O-antigen/teichoic acid export membrane protein